MYQGLQKECVFFEERGSQGVLQCLSEKLQGMEWTCTEVWQTGRKSVLIWGWWRTGESALNTLSCKSLLDTQGEGKA